MHMSCPRVGPFELTYSFLLDPRRRQDLGIQFNEWMQVVLVGKILKILPDLRPICIET